MGATRAFTQETIELSNGDEVVVRTLPITPLRTLMDKFEELGKVMEAAIKEAQEDGGDPKDKVDTDKPDVLSGLLDCSQFILNRVDKKYGELDDLGEVVDVPTAWKLLEIAGGIKFDDPNPMGTAQGGKT